MSAQAAPLCSSLFETHSTAPGDLSELLMELAKLKMEVDLAVSQGTIGKSPVLKTMQAGYKIKLEKLRQTSGLSDVEIKTTLSERIRKLQNQEKQTQEEAIKGRDEQIKAQQIFTSRGEKKLHPVGDFKDFSYIPHLNRWSIYALDGPRFYRLEDGKMEFTLIGFTKGFKILPDLKHGLAIEPLEHAVNLYEMGKREPVNTFPTDMAFTDGAGIEFSPSNQQALITDFYGKAHLLNFSTKQFTTISMPRKLTYSYAKRIGYFISETVVLFAGETSIARLDLTTGKVIEKELFTNEQHQATISEDGKTVLIYSSKKMIALNAETLEAVSPVMNFEVQGKSVEEIIKVPGTDQLFVRTKDLVSLEHSFETDIEVPQFDIQVPFPLAQGTTKITLSQDGSEAFVLRKDEKNIFYIEHWKR